MNILVADTITYNGVSTAIFLTISQRSNLINNDSLASFVTSIAIEKSQVADPPLYHIRTEELHQHFPQDSQTLPKGFFVVDAKEDVSAADAAANYLYKTVSGLRRSHIPTRVANEPVVAENPKAAVALLGVLTIGFGDWTPFMRIIKPFANPNDLYQFPIQTWQTGLKPKDDPRLAGLVSWCGEGVARKDGRESFKQINGPLGEGCLRIEQMISEVLSKLSLKEKYGA